MNDDMIKPLWNQGKQQEPKLNPQEISNLLAKSARTGWSRLRINVWIFALLLVVALLFNVLNVIGFVENPGWLAVQVALALITLTLLAFNLRVLRPLQSLDDPSVELPTLVKRQLHFFHTTFEWWLWVAPVTCWLLSFSVSVWMENQDGQYRINRLGVFVAASAAMILCTYAVFRLGHLPLIQRSLAALHDLEAQVTDQTRRVQKQRKYWIIAGALLAIALTLSAVWGLVTWMAATR